MQVELKLLQREVGITFIFVTHDQDEALTMADRIAVFRDGRLEQVGSPQDVYERPETSFVADFIGTSNVADGAAAVALFGSEGQYSLRPERIHLVDPDGSAGAAAQVLDVVYAGALLRHVVTLDAGPTWVVTAPATGSEVGATPRRGDRVHLTWNDDAVRRLG
jgi:putative spermidine/putrescine transport system ATP-binding protein